MADRAREQYMDAVTDPDRSGTEEYIDAAKPTGGGGTGVEQVSRQELISLVETLYGRAAINEGFRGNLIKGIQDGRLTTVSDIEGRIVTAYKYSGSNVTDGISTDEAKKVVSSTFEDAGHSTEAIDESAKPSSFHDWAGSVGDWLMIDDDERANNDYKKAMLTLLRSQDAVDEATYNNLVQKINDHEVGMDEFEDVLRDAGFTSSEIDDVRERSVYAVDRGRNYELQMAARVNEERASEREYTETGDVAAANTSKLRQFQLLDEQYPSKYKFDDTTKAIFTWSDADQQWVPADENGEPTAMIDMEEGMFTVAAQWANDRPEWVRMSESTGINVTEADYFELLHVVENPEQYGADASRYLPGMPDFLGGFGSQFTVSRREEQARMEDWRRFGVTDRAEADFLLRSGQQGQLPSDMVDTVSRPFYDPNDNWALFAGLSVEDISAIQNKMVAIGAMDAEDVAWGYWSSAEASAMNEWLYVANGNAQRWDEVADSAIREHFEQINESAGTGRSVYTAPAYQKMDPATANQTIKAVIRQQLGREPTDDEMAQFGTDMAQDHRDAFVADVEAEKMRFNANQDELGDPGDAPGDVDYEARFLERFEERKAPELEAVRQGEQLGARQDIVGGSLDNIMRRLGGGIG